jgi:hypothetical protein
MKKFVGVFINTIGIATLENEGVGTIKTKPYKSKTLGTPL